MSKIEVLKEMPIVEMVQPIAISVAEFQQNMESNIVETQAQTWSLWSILTWVFVVGMAFFLLKFSIGLYKIFQLYKKGEKQPKKGFKLVITEGVKTPFSFFNWIFINDKITENADFQQIIAHEKAHVQQKHSFDIVGLEILRGVFWLSPLVHLYARSLRNVHEYLADAAALKNAEKKQYGRLLISQTVAGSGLVLANHFNFSQLKKRIIMMTRNRSQRWMLLKYMLVAPLFLLLVSFFIKPNNIVMSKTVDFSDNVTSTIETLGKTIQNKITPVNNTILDIENPTILNDSTRNPPFDVVKNPIPNPFVTIAGRSNGLINRETFQNQWTLSVSQPKYGYPVICAIQSFQLIRVSFGLNANQESKNNGQKFNAETLALVKQAQDGDSYQFVNIKGRCPGDVAARDLGNMSFIIGDNDVDENRLNKIYLTESAKQVFMFTNGHVGGAISAEEVKQQNEIIGFDFTESPPDKCDIINFTLTKTMSNGISNIANNQTGRFSPEVKKMFEKAVVGDAFIFSNVKMKNITKNKEVQAEDSRFIVNSLTKDVYVNNNNYEPLPFRGHPDKDGIYTIVEQHPEYPEGAKAMFDYMNSNIKYPEEARKLGVEGTVYVGFVVEKDGSLSRITVKRGIGSGCNEEAVRIIKTLPNWKPGFVKGKAVRTAYTLPIKFKLPK
jgi:TonB family protein